MTGAELLVRCLEREGVRYVFGVPGEETLDVNEALAHSSIRFVPVRHEQAAAFMADVWGRLTGHAGVCLATLGPGATNLATGVADANLDRAPVVAITGQLARHLLHKESHQYVDIVDVFRPFTKWNARIETGAVVAEAVRKAFKRAQEEKPGACHLELPEDVAREPAEGGPHVPDRPRRLKGPAGVGPANHGPGATNLATGVADANLDRAPVVAITGQLARHLLHKESHQYVDIVDVFRPFTKWNARIETGAVVAEAVRKAFKRAQEEKPGACHLELPEDVAREPAEGEPLVADRPRRPSPDRPSLARAADIINRAERPLVLAGNGVIRGHASKELTSLAERAQIPVVTTFMAKGAIAVDHPLARTTVGLASDDPARVGFTSADVVIAVGYDPVEYSAAQWNPSGRLRIVHIDFTAAEVDARYQPAVRVVAVTGDGGLLMNIQELETAVRLGLGFVVLIFRDDGYGVIRWKQERQFGHTAGVDFGNPDFVALARAFGCAGARVNAAKELAPALADALRATVPVLIDCPVDYRENDRLAEY